MSITQFNDIKTLSNIEISESIIKTEKELFNLKFKKATRQPFKSHEIKFAKRRLAQLKTLLVLRVNTLEQTKTDTLDNLVQKQNYLTNSF